MGTEIRLLQVNSDEQPDVQTTLLDNLWVSFQAYIFCKGRR